jgi:hypothetical protein
MVIVEGHAPSSVAAMFGADQLLELTYRTVPDLANNNARVLLGVGYVVRRILFVMSTFCEGSVFLVFSRF